MSMGDNVFRYLGTQVLAATGTELSHNVCEAALGPSICSRGI
jgi:hypothetical protein